MSAEGARALREFADTTRFPSDWILFRRDDGSGVTVSDLLREAAAREAAEFDKRVTALPAESGFGRLLYRLHIVRRSEYDELWNAYSDVFGWWSKKIRSEADAKARLLAAVMAVDPDESTGDPDDWALGADSAGWPPEAVQQIPRTLADMDARAAAYEERPGQPSTPITEPPAPPSGPASAAAPEYVPIGNVRFIDGAWMDFEAGNTGPFSSPTHRVVYVHG